MKNFIVYNKGNGEILRSGVCSDDAFENQPQNLDELVIEGNANDTTQKVVGGKVVDKPPEEIEPPIPFEQQQASITNTQWDSVLDRLTQLEEK